MSALRRLCTMLVMIAALAAPQTMAAQPPQPQDEFVPLSEVPPEEQLPAQPLVAAAYGLVWLAILGYVFSIARRLETVQGELHRLEADVKRSGRG